MKDFSFVKIPNLESWVILAPKRATRPIQKNGKKSYCPFCPGNEDIEKEVFRIGGVDHDSNWLVRVLPNKYPFAPIHEVVVHAPFHHRHFSDLSVERIQLVIEAYVNRFNLYVKKGTVCIFGNAGPAAGESIVHPHSQIAVIPRSISVSVPSLESNLKYKGEHFLVSEFELVCPQYSQWPDEIWIVPRTRNRLFGEITSAEVTGLASILKRVTRIFEIRHGYEFPYNYYIYPYKDWYLRIMPRAKIPGGFEMATGIFVNTQDPKDTMEFIKKHFNEDQEEKIKRHTAKYRRGV